MIHIVNVSKIVIENNHLEPRPIRNSAIRKQPTLACVIKKTILHVSSSDRKGH